MGVLKILTMFIVILMNTTVVFVLNYCIHYFL